VVTPEPARSGAQRRRDLLARLGADIDLWLATAAPSGGGPHLVPLSFVWHRERIVMATAGGSPTVANLRALPRARAALDGTRDVVLIEGVVDVLDGGSDPAAEAAFAAHTGWDAAASPGYVFLALRPERILSWREENELAGRTLMRAGAWLV
jgi:hypothetical protein